MVAHLKSENLQVQLARQENDDIDDASFFDPRVVRKVMGALLFVCFVFFSVTGMFLSLYSRRFLANLSSEDSLFCICLVFVLFFSNPLKCLPIFALFF